MRKGFIIKLRPLEGLEIGPRRIVTSRFLGSYKSVFRGKGLEFVDYKEFVGGDDASLIDWKASSRAGKLLVKEFAEERNINIFFLIDVSSSMVYSSISKLKSEYAAELVGSLGFLVLHSGDSIGFALFTDKIIKSSLPVSGIGKHYAFMKELTDVENYGGGYDIVYALKSVNSFLERNSVLIIVSDFIGLKGEWETRIKLASQKYDVIGIMIRDIRDKNLPKMGLGTALLEDPFTGEQIVVDTKKVGPAYKKYVSRQEKKIKEVFLKSNSDFLSLTTDEDFVDSLFKFFKSRGSRSL